MMYYYWWLEACWKYCLTKLIEKLCVLLYNEIIVTLWYCMTDWYWLIIIVVKYCVIVIVMILLTVEQWYIVMIWYDDGIDDVKYCWRWPVPLLLFDVILYDDGIVVKLLMLVLMTIIDDWYSVGLMMYSLLWYYRMMYWNYDEEFVHRWCFVTLTIDDVVCWYHWWLPCYWWWWLYYGMLTIDVDIDPVHYYLFYWWYDTDDIDDVIDDDGIVLVTVLKYWWWPLWCRNWCWYYCYDGDDVVMIHWWYWWLLTWYWLTDGIVCC